MKFVKFVQTVREFKVRDVRDSRGVRAIRDVKDIRNVRDTGNACLRIFRDLRTAILLLPVALTSCSYVSKSYFAHNHDKSYLAARSIPPLKVPPGLNDHSFHNAYPLPDQAYPYSIKDVNLAPPGLYDGK